MEGGTYRQRLLVFAITTALRQRSNWASYKGLVGFKNRSERVLCEG